MESPLPLLIRPMTLEDVPCVRQIDVLSFSLPWSERSYRFEVMENTHSSNWVAEVTLPDGSREIAAMMVIWIILDEAHIATIAVLKEYRRQGMGKRLLAQGLLAAHERGARLAYLEVRRSNLNALAMYEQFGFQVVGERPKYYQDNQEDALLMTLFQLEPEKLAQWV